MLGGDWIGGSKAGGFYWYVYGISSYRGRSIGVHLIN